MGVLIVILFLVPLILPSIKYFLAGKQNKKETEFEERQILGNFSEYNPRVKEIQEMFSEKNIVIGEIDGYIGQKTREGVKKFQKENNLKPTGIIDKATLIEIDKKIEDFRKKEILSEFVKYEEINDDKYSIFQDQKNNIHDEVLNYRLLSKEKVSQIQKALKNAGYYKEQIDGKVGKRTKSSIKKFQKSKNLKPDGVVGPKTWEALNQYMKD